MEKFYEAWHWLDRHPLFAVFGDRGTNCLYIEVVKVNPENETIEEDESLNTAVRVWVEGGPWAKHIIPGENEEAWGWSHDIDLDCGGETYKEAVIEFAARVKEKYGDYGEYSWIRDKELEEFWSSIIRKELE